MNLEFKKNSFNSFLIKNKIGILVIAKLGSKRLRHKIKKKINQFSLIEVLIKRLVNEIGHKNLIICSSGKKSKKFLLPLKKKYKIKLFFGHSKDVLGRVINCMKKYDLKHCVRVTGDNPFTDCDAIKKMIFSHLKKKNDYTYTSFLPIGMRSEIFSFNSLTKCYKNIISKNSTEYLTYFFLRRDLYKVENFKFKKIFLLQNKLSITIDYEKDLILFKKILKLNNENIFLKRRKIINFLRYNSKLVNTPSKIPIKCKKYDVRYFFDSKKKFIFLN